jgi:hypothetical protein
MKKTIIRDIMKVFAVGATAALMGAIAIGMASLSVCMFCTIPETSGYIAVCGFMFAIAAAGLALATVYMCGCWMVKKGKFSR